MKITKEVHEHYKNLPASESRNEIKQYDVTLKQKATDTLAERCAKAIVNAIDVDINLTNGCKIIKLADNRNNIWHKANRELFKNHPIAEEIDKAICGGIAVN